MSNSFRARIAAVCEALERRTLAANGGMRGLVFVECEHPELLATPNPTEQEMAEARRRGYPLVRVRFVRPGFYEADWTGPAGHAFGWSSAEAGDELDRKIQAVLDALYRHAEPAGEEFL